MLPFPPCQRNILSRKPDPDREYDQHKRGEAKKNFERAKQHSLSRPRLHKGVDQFVDSIAFHCFGNANEKLVGPIGIIL